MRWGKHRFSVATGCSARFSGHCRAGADAKVVARGQARARPASHTEERRRWWRPAEALVELVGRAARSATAALWTSCGGLLSDQQFIEELTAYTAMTATLPWPLRSSLDCEPALWRIQYGRASIPSQCRQYRKYRQGPIARCDTVTACMVGWCFRRYVTSATAPTSCVSSVRAFSSARLRCRISFARSNSASITSPASAPANRRNGR